MEKLFKLKEDLHNEMMIQVKIMGTITKEFINASNDEKIPLEEIEKLYKKMNAQYCLLIPVMEWIIDSAKHAKRCKKSQEELYQEIRNAEVYSKIEST